MSEASGEAIGAGEDGRCLGVVEHLEDGVGWLAAGGVFAVALRSVLAVGVVVGFKDVDKSVEAFVHKGPAALV